MLLNTVYSLSKTFADQRKCKTVASVNLRDNRRENFATKYQTTSLNSDNFRINSIIINNLPKFFKAVTKLAKSYPSDPPKLRIHTSIHFFFQISVKI